MDFWEVVVGVVVGSATTAFGWWLNERSARSRQWASDKRKTYGDFLAAARRLERYPGVLTVAVRRHLIGPERTEADLERSGNAADALADLTAASAQIWLIAPLDVMTASNAVLGAANDLVDSAPDDEAVAERWHKAKNGFEDAARKDLGIPL